MSQTQVVTTVMQHKFCVFAQFLIQLLCTSDPLITTALVRSEVVFTPNYSCSRYGIHENTMLFPADYRRI